MTFFDKIYNQLFGKAKESKELVSETLKRSEEERKAYFEWQNQGAYKPLLKKVWQAYQDRLNEINSEWQIHLLQMKGANGFALTYHSAIGKRPFQQFFDLMKDKVLNLGYKLSNSDVRIRPKDDFVETKERYYLKPLIDATNTEELFDQKFGNVLIEHILINDRPSYIKFTASTYSDRLYTEPLTFEDLIQEIFEKN